MKYLDDDLRKSVRKILDDSSEIQDSCKTKRHLREWYTRDARWKQIFGKNDIGELSGFNIRLLNLLSQNQYKEKLKDEVFIDYQGGNGVFCLYLNTLGYNTYFHDMDSKEARHLFSHFNLQDKIINNRDDLFKNTPPFTVAMSLGWSLNDDLGDPITDIESLKYLILDGYGIYGTRRGSCKKTDTSGFSKIDTLSSHRRDVQILRIENYSD